MKELLPILPSQGQLVGLLWGIITIVLLFVILNSGALRDLIANWHEDYLNKKKYKRL